MMGDPKILFQVTAVTLATLCAWVIYVNAKFPNRISVKPVADSENPEKPTAE